MKLPFFTRAMLPIVVVTLSVGMVGCQSARDALRLSGTGAVADVDTSDLVEHADAIVASEQAGPAESAHSDVALVSSVSKPAVPTLRTLAADEDLMAEIESAPGPVLIDFYADWCGPCRTQGKVLHDLEPFAAKHSAQIIKVDIEAHPAIAKQFQVASLPTLVVIKDGEITSRETGLKQAERIRDLLR